MIIDINLSEKYKKRKRIEYRIGNNEEKIFGAKYPEKKKKVFDLVQPGGYWRDLPDDVARDYMKSCYFIGGGRTGIASRNRYSY